MSASVEALEMFASGVNALRTGDRVLAAQWLQRAAGAGFAEAYAALARWARPGVEAGRSLPSMAIFAISRPSDGHASATGAAVVDRVCVMARFAPKPTIGPVLFHRMLGTEPLPFSPPSSGRDCKRFASAYRRLDLT